MDSNQAAGCRAVNSSFVLLSPPNKQVSKAKVGAKVNAGVTATLLPNIKDRDKGAEVFRLMSKNLNDDKAAFEFLCPMQVCGLC